MLMQLLLQFISELKHDLWKSTHLGFIWYVSTKCIFWPYTNYSTRCHLFMLMNNLREKKNILTRGLKLTISSCGFNDTTTVLHMAINKKNSWIWDFWLPTDGIFKSTLPILLRHIHDNSLWISVSSFKFSITYKTKNIIMLFIFYLSDDIVQNISHTVRKQSETRRRHLQCPRS